jgi:glycerophosphoryl diester phosphodiesterase
MNEFFSNTILFGEGTLNALHINAGPLLDYFMIAMTKLGDQVFYFAALPALYWCVDKKTAVSIGAVFLVSTILNAIVKQVYLNPRPNPDLLAAPIRELYNTYAPKSPGFPSGHTQGAAAFWGAAMIFTRNKIVIAIGAALIILVPYSRLYLGVHYPGDVLGGYLLGGITLAVMAPLMFRYEKKEMRADDRVVPALLAVLPWIIYWWMPVMFLLEMMSVLAGLAAGLILAKNRIVFSEKNRPLAQFVKIATGMFGIGLVFLAGTISWSSPAAAGFTRYWIMGFWITFIAPLMFSRCPFLKGDTGNN